MFPGSEPYMQFYDSRMHIQLERWDMTKTFPAIDEWASRSDLHKAFVIFHIKSTLGVFEWNWVEHTKNDAAWGW